MTRNVHTTTRDATLESAARLMKDREIGMLPVVSPEGRVVGTLTDRDIAVRAAAKGLEPARTRVEDAMTPGCEFCHEDDALESVARRMGEKRLRRVVVMEQNERAPAGILSIGDLSTYDAGRRLVGDVLARVTAR